jgi:hypothetical protein
MLCLLVNCYWHFEGVSSRIPPGYKYMHYPPLKHRAQHLRTLESSPPTDQSCKWQLIWYWYIAVWSVSSNGLLTYQKGITDAKQNDTCKWGTELSLTLPNWINTSLTEEWLKKQSSSHFCLSLCITKLPPNPQNMCSQEPLNLLSHIHENT